MLGAFFAGGQRTPEQQIETLCVDAHEQLTGGGEFNAGSAAEGIVSRRTADSRNLLINEGARGGDG
jgi:hypothetical protein